MNPCQSEAAYRKIGFPLIIGLYVLPALFGWFLLRRGYANSTRTAAFIYAAITVALGMVHAAEIGG